MAVQSSHLSASLRLLDSNSKGLGSINRVRPDLSQANVSDFIKGVNAIRENTATNATLTILTELSEK